MKGGMWRTLWLGARPFYNRQGGGPAEDAASSACASSRRDLWSDYTFSQRKDMSCPPRLALGAKSHCRAILGPRPRRPAGGGVHADNGRAASSRSQRRGRKGGNQRHAINRSFVAHVTVVWQSSPRAPSPFLRFGG